VSRTKDIRRHLVHRQEIGHSVVPAKLQEESSRLAAMMRLMIEQMRHRKPQWMNALDASAIA
jgi:hypothetical protein